MEILDIEDPSDFQYEWSGPPPQQEEQLEVNNNDVHRRASDPSIHDRQCGSGPVPPSPKPRAPSVPPFPGRCIWHLQSPFTRDRHEVVGTAIAWRSDTDVRIDAGRLDWL